MALIRKMDLQLLPSNRVHRDAPATYAIFVAENGEKYLQVDTYLPAEGRAKGRVAQSIQFGPAAIEKLKRILTGEF